MHAACCNAHLSAPTHTQASQTPTPALPLQSGVVADDISRDDYLNAPGEKYSVKLTAAGSYRYYCDPHQGAGMVGKVR